MFSNADKKSYTGFTQTVNPILNPNSIIGTLSGCATQLRIKVQKTSVECTLINTCTAYEKEADMSASTGISEQSPKNVLRTPSKTIENNFETI